MTDIMIESIDATKTFNPGKHNEVTPVRSASFQIEKGSIAVLSGPSGSGKTTLLSMIGCQLKPSSGEIILNGKRICKLPEKFANEFKREHIGFIFQHFQLIPELSVLDNITLPLLPTGVSRQARLERADLLLSRMDLADRKKFRVKELSGGEQQRVAICRALINGCSLLLADEPTAHLDSQLTSEFIQVMKDLKELGFTIVIASHNAAITDSPIVDQKIEMKDGEILS